MNKTEVMALLEENQNERGIANWKKLDTGKVRSFGIGLTPAAQAGKEDRE